jgi:hypothetical protein
MRLTRELQNGVLEAKIVRSTPDAGSRPSMFRVGLMLLYVAGFAVVGAGLYAGRDLYLAPLNERAHTAGYWEFKPGGSIGLPFGIAGATMMTLLLLYSVRKRVPALRRFGALARWLDIHILLGVVGPLLIVLHSSFKVRGLVSLSFWSMVAVASSGVLGRYLYLQIPRTRAGHEVALADLVEEDLELTERLRREFGLDEERLRALDAIAAPAKGRSLLGALLDLLVADLVTGHRLRRFARETGVSSSAYRPLIRIIFLKARTHRRIVLWDAMHRLFHHWHVIHKPFAIVMYLFMVVHVVVASMTGYGWSR